MRRSLAAASVGSIRLTTPNADGIYTATNTLVTESVDDTPTTITVQKVWQPAAGVTHPGSVYRAVAVQQDGGTTWADFQDPETLNSSNKWEHTWTNLPDLSGQNVEYQVVETVPEGYVQLPIKEESKTDDVNGGTIYTYTITNVL